MMSKTSDNSTFLPLVRVSLMHMGGSPPKKEAMPIPAGGCVLGLAHHCAVEGEQSPGRDVLGWHVEERQGHRSVHRGGPGITHIDVVRGHGRIPGQAHLQESGRAALLRL